MGGDSSDKGLGKGDGHSSPGATFHVPLAAYNTDELPGKTIQASLDKIRETLMNEQPGVMGKLKVLFGDLSEANISMLSLEDLIAGTHSTDIPFGLGNWREVNAFGGHESHLSLSQRLVNCNTYMPIPLAIYNTLLLDIEAVVAFLAPVRNSAITPQTLSVALGHACFRQSIGEGTLVAMREAGYVIRVKGLLMMMLSANSPQNGLCYYPAGMCSDARSRLRAIMETIALVDNIEEQRDQANKVVAPASTNYGRFAAIAIFAGDSASPTMNSIFTMHTSLSNAAAVQQSARPRKFMYKMLSSLISCLFQDVRAMPENLFSFGAPDPCREVSTDNIKETTGTFKGKASLRKRSASTMIGTG